MTELTPEKQDYEASPQCPECFGKTVLWRGKGLDSEYYICSRYKESGHLSDAEIRAKINRLRSIINPSGRFAG